MNKIIISGRLTKDPVIKELEDGKTWAGLTVAVDRPYKAADGNTPTDFVNVNAYDQRAKYAGKYLQKGTFVIVQGEMRSQKRETKSGDEFTSWALYADSIEAGAGWKTEKKDEPDHEQQKKKIRNYDDEEPF